MSHLKATVSVKGNTDLSGNLPPAEPSCALETSFHLPKEGSDQTEWVLVSADILSEGSPLNLNASCLVDRILEKEGRVAVVTHGAGPAADSDPAPSGKKLEELTRKYGNERISVLYLEPPASSSTDKIWIRDYLGVFIPTLNETEGFRYLHSNTPHSGHWSREWQYEDIIRRIEGADIVIPELPVVGGDFSVLGDKTLLLTDSFRRNRVDHVVDSSPDLQMAKLKTTAQLMGREVLFAPTPFDNIAHSDCIACQVGDSVFIPEIADHCTALTPHRRALDRARTALAGLEQRLKENGFKVEKLPMGLPGFEELLPGKDSFTQVVLRDCLMPCNLIQVVDPSGGLHVMVPWGVSDRIRNPSEIHYSSYREEVEEKLKSAGAESVSFVPFPASSTGGLHCITKNVPGSIMQVLKRELSEADDPLRLLSLTTRTFDDK